MLNLNKYTLRLGFYGLLAFSTTIFSCVTEVLATAPNTEIVVEKTNEETSLYAGATKMMADLLTEDASFLGNEDIPTVSVCDITSVSSSYYEDYIKNFNDIANSLSSEDMDIAQMSTAGLTEALPTENILNMSEKELWLLISDGAFSSYTEANMAAQQNFALQKDFWTSKMTGIDIPTWTMVDGKKVESTARIYVNKRLAIYFTDYFNELHALPEQYCFSQIYAFSFRAKNNGTRTCNLSAHSFGAAFDVNWNFNGMGSNPAQGGGIGSGNVVNSRKELDVSVRDYIETLDSSWLQLTNKYKLDWGGYWSTSSKDPMHHSLVGDRNIDSRTNDSTTAYEAEVDTFVPTEEELQETSDNQITDVQEQNTPAIEPEQKVEENTPTQTEQPIAEEQTENTPELAPPIQNTEIYDSNGELVTVIEDTPIVLPEE